jgi:hypothetical protein
MKMRTKVLLTVLFLCAPLIFSPALHAQTVVAPDLSGPETFLVPGSDLEHRPLNLLSRSPFLVNGLTAGTVLIYDDPATPRPEDYFELYDNAGDLVAVGCFDRFGIRRMAVDRGLVEEKADLEGVFVTLLEGDSI